jgi:two-component system, LytTR family, sensor kinase
MKMASKYPNYYIALLMTILASTPKLLLVMQNPENHPFSDFGMQALFSFLYAFIFLELNERVVWSLWKKIGLFILIHLIITFLFANAHLLLLNVDEKKGIIRYGYHFRNLMLLASSVVISNFLKTIQQKQLLIIQNKNLETENLQAQLNSLQQQLNPHFLFNSLNSLHSLIIEDPKKGQDFVQNLSLVFRYSLDFQKKKLITIHEELQFIEAYFYLLKIRFGDKLLFNFDKIKAIKGYIPPFALQLLIENAVNHNEISTKKPLIISIDFDDELKQLRIKNNLNPKRQPSNGAGLGLLNLKNRYLLLTNKLIEIEQNETFFEVKIPVTDHEDSNF